jgi:hypothetical protein
MLGSAAGAAPGGGEGEGLCRQFDRMYSLNQAAAELINNLQA